MNNFKGESDISLYPQISIVILAVGPLKFHLYTQEKKVEGHSEVMKTLLCSQAKCA